jgi:hypothetical protein
VNTSEEKPSRRRAVQDDNIAQMMRVSPCRRGENFMPKETFALQIYLITLDF